MITSIRGTLEICEHEGIVPTVYRDSQRVLTYGVGHTKNAGGPNPARMSMAMPANVDAAVEEAIEIFRQDLSRYEDRVSEAITAPLEQWEFDALVSFDFNTGGIYRAILTKAINAGKDGASEHFFGWMKPPEIKKRRRAEERLFRTGDYDHNGNMVPIWGTDGKGNLSGVIDRMSGDEIMAIMGELEEGSRVAAEPTRDVPWFISFLRELFG